MEIVQNKFGGLKKIRHKIELGNRTEFRDPITLRRVVLWNGGECGVEVSVTDRRGLLDPKFTVSRRKHTSRVFVRRGDSHVETVGPLTGRIIIKS